MKITVSFPLQLNPTPLDGRMLLMVSNNDKAEPRFQISEDPDTQLVFGVDVEGLTPGQKAMFDASVFGYLLRSLAELPPGEYFVQALLHRYETFRSKDGHVVKLPMDRGEGQQWNGAPGNLYNTPKKMRLDPKSSATIAVTLDKEIPPIAAPKDSKYIKYVKMQSRLLTEFWGRPMELGAVVLLPEGIDTHPEAYYLLVINHGHFPYIFEGFREEPPDPNLKTDDYNKRFQISGYNKMQQEYAHQFYRDWTGPDFPRFLIIEIQHPNPFYDDSYAVNSQNLGSYGDAITYELIPFIEKKFRGIGQGWARFLYGGSTGGWEALAAQVFYPDEYNGCWAACPNPVDFRAYTTVNLYCGDMDNFYLNNAVYLVEEIRKNLRDPLYTGEVDYGDRAEHCWNGDHSAPIWISRLRYHQIHAPKVLRRIMGSAPPGTDLTSWQ